MKKISLLLILIAQAAISQVKTGDYVSNRKGEKTKLRILDDKNYEVVFLYGEYQQNGNSVKFSQFNNSNTFEVEYQTDSKKSDKITVEISGSSLYYYYSKIYFGTQNNNSTVEYKPLSDLIGDISNDYALDKKYTFEIDKTDFIYLVEDNLTEESQIQKYSLPKNVSKIDVIYAVNYINKLNLTGEVDSKTGGISISDNGREPLLFSFKKDEKSEDTGFVKPTETLSEKNWTYIGKKEIKDIYGYPVDSAAVAVDTAYEAKPAYIFKTKVEDNLKSALEVAKKQSDKYFVLFYDKNPETAKANFETFIKNYETNAGYYMYDNYIPEYDSFNFYLASKKDKDFIKKFSSEDSVMAIFDSNGNKLYHAKWDQVEAESIFSPYAYSTKTELEPVKSNVSIDQLFSNPKSSSDDIITQLEKLCNITMPYDYSDGAVVALAKEVEDVREDVKEVEEIKDIEKATETAAEAAAKAAVEAASEVIEPTYDYSLLKEKNNLYKLKSTPESVNNRWKQILDNAKVGKDFNYKVAKIANAEVSNIGFNKALFKQDKKLLNTADFSSLDYLIKNYDAIKNYQKTDSLDYSEPLANVIDYNVTTVLNKNLDKENGADKLHYDKVLSYYKKFLAASKNNPTLSKGYMEALKSQDLQTDYLEAYNNYFNSILPNNSNFIEQLDKAYVAENSYEDWKSYKYNFANTANEASWYVVEKVKDANAIKNAIKWSETSLAIEKENAYFLDTLAQLYYKNGQKERAIQTQLIAIEKIDQVYESETKEQMKNVLTKMQNGTY